MTDTESILFVGVGLGSAFTTCSSCRFETVRIWERGGRAVAVGNAVSILALSLLGFGLAWWFVG